MLRNGAEPRYLIDRSVHRAHPRVMFRGLLGCSVVLTLLVGCGSSFEGSSEPAGAGGAEAALLRNDAGAPSDVGSTSSGGQGGAGAGSGSIAGTGGDSISSAGGPPVPCDPAAPGFSPDNPACASPYGSDCYLAPLTDAEQVCTERGLDTYEAKAKKQCPSPCGQAVYGIPTEDPASWCCPKL